MSQFWPKLLQQFTKIMIMMTEMIIAVILHFYSLYFALPYLLITYTYEAIKIHNTVAS